jgi:hypothetical protein
MNRDNNAAVFYKKGDSGMADSSRHHHNPELLLRQFAEPMFSDNIRVFEMKIGRWDPGRRTPNGVGWGRHLYSSWDLDGTRHDRFEQFLTENVDTVCADVMKKAAVGFEGLAGDDYGHLAHFMGYLAARSRGLIDNIQQEHRAKREKDDWLVKAWCAQVGIKFDDTAEDKMLKDSLLRAVDDRASAWRDKLLSGRWAFMKAPRNDPFITSDWPVFGRDEGEYWFVTFAISSEVATLVSNHPKARFQPGPEAVRAVNVNTMVRASRFIVCPKESFPGDEHLATWASRKRSL